MTLHTSATQIKMANLNLLANANFFYHLEPLLFTEVGGYPEIHLKH